MDIVDITSETIQVEKIISSFKNPSIGATSIFLGTTRNTFDGKEVVSLEYEAYQEMAISEMRRICAEMYRKWPLLGIAVVHRIGSVSIGEISILIVACSAHRKAAQEAVMFCIDEVKATVPIWKKEMYSDGTSNWKSNEECEWKEGKDGASSS